MISPNNNEVLEQEKEKLEPVLIYRCKNLDCKAWVRDEFGTEGQPCPLCKGPMLRSIKHLPAIIKAKKKRTSKKNG